MEGAVGTEDSWKSARDVVCGRSLRPLPTPSPPFPPPLFPRGLRSLLEALTPAEALNLADPRQGLGCWERGNSNTENRVSVKVCKPEMSRNSI